MATTFMQVFVVVMAFVVTSHASSHMDDAMEVIDMTYDSGPDAVYWPIYPAPSLNVMMRGVNPDNNLYMEFNTFGMAEHTGTHSDAPAHFKRNGWRTQQVPASRLVGEGVVVDVSSKVTDNHLYKTTVQDFLDWEATHGRIPDYSVVFVHTGWGERYPNRSRVFNSATGNDTDYTTFRFPTFEGEAAEFLANNRTIIAVGVDVPGPDLNIPAHPAHVALLSKDILILENVANIDKLPTKGAVIVIGMMKLYDGSGGPSRLLALKGASLKGNCNCPTGAAASQHVSVIMMIGAVMMSVFSRA